MNLDSIGKTVQVLSVVAGVVISVLSYNSTRAKELEAQEIEAQARRQEAAKPFLELRQKLYTDALKAAAILSTPENRASADLAKARQRFRELYVAELSMVEVGAVESKMVELASQIDPALLNMTPSQRATYELAHSLRDSFIPDWGIQALH